ncbi:MAG: hypothetical protein ACRDAM_04240 [Casimicrobium sp.]
MKPSQTLYPRPKGLAGYLDRMPQLRAGLNQARASIRSEHSLKECLPPKILGALHSVHSAGFSLVISVTSAEAAHWVRLLRSDIERALADKGLKFNEILVNVQTKTAIRGNARIRPDSRTVQKMRTDSTKITSERLQTSLQRLSKTLDRD